MDAIDAALVEFDRTAAAKVNVIAARAAPYPGHLKATLTALVDAPNAVSLDTIGALDVQIGIAFAQVALDLLSSCGVPSTEVTAIGSHGQTLRHQAAGQQHGTPAPFSWQIR